MRRARILFLILCLVVLASCGKEPPPRGSAQDQSARSTARADATAIAADEAGVAAARARARADHLQREAVATPTEQRIRLAVDARLEAEVAEGVAKELKAQAEKATDEAERAAQLAREEREAEQRAADDRRWRILCRWLGLGGLVAGVLLGGVLAYFAGPRVGVPMGALITGTGLLVVAYGATVSWLPLVLAGVVLAGLVAWAIASQRTLRLGMELSRTVDVIEGKAKGTVKDAKQDLGKALDRSGLRPRFQRLRARWQA